MLRVIGLRGNALVLPGSKELLPVDDIGVILVLVEILTGTWFDELKTEDKGNFFYEKDGITMNAKTEYKTVYLD
jgi:hypothetical protein